MWIKCEYNNLDYKLFTFNRKHTILKIIIKEDFKMFEKVKNVLIEALNVDENAITLEANLKDDLGIDSL